MGEKIETFYNTISKSKNQKIILGIFIVVIFVLTLLLNHLYPLILDDYVYSFVYAGDPERRVSTLHDLFESQYNHYFMWGGRTIVHFIAQFLLSLKPIWHDLLNSLAFISLMLMMYKISNLGTSKKNIAVFLIITILSSIMQPGFTATVLWITGSANYLWGTLIILLFLYPFYNYYITKQSKDSIVKSIIFFILGIIAGWTNENMSIALCFLILFLLIIFKIQKIKIPKWTITSLFGLVLGCVIMLAAPGNYVRYELEMQGRGIPIEVANSLSIYFERLTPICKLYRKRMLLLTLINIILFILYLKTNKSNNKREIITMWLLVFVSAHLATIAMVGAPEFADRAAFGVITFLILSLGIIYVNLGVESIIPKRFYQYFTILVLLSLSIYYVIDYSKKYKVIHQISEVMSTRSSYIEEHKKQGQQDFIFKGKLEVRSKYYFMDFEEDPDFVWNKQYSRFMGIRSIIVIPEKNEQHD